VKQRSTKNGSQVNDWATPEYVKNYIRKEFFNDNEFFDPCPLHSCFNGLECKWGKYNFVNPPYTRKLKEAFITKAIRELEVNYFSTVLLIPANTDTKIFYKLANYYDASLYFIRGRIPFIGYNTKCEKVDSKCGQFGSMFVHLELGNSRNNKLNNITLDEIKMIGGEE